MHKTTLKFETIAHPALNTLDAVLFATGDAGVSVDVDTNQGTDTVS